MTTNNNHPFAVGRAFSTRSFPALFAQDPLFRVLEDLGTTLYETKGMNYPCNIIEELDDDDHVKSTRIEIALAAFKKEEVSVKIVGDELRIVIGSATEQVPEVGPHERYVKQGISKRSVKLAYSLSGKVNKKKVISKFEDGLLVIHLPYQGDDVIEIEVK